MSALEASAIRVLNRIEQLRNVDRGADRPRWVNLARDILVYLSLERWLAMCSQTQWEDIETYERLQPLMAAVQRTLAGGPVKIATALQEACTSPIVITPEFPFTPPAEDGILDPRLGQLAETLRRQSDFAIQYARSSTDAALTYASVLFVTSRQYVLACRAVRTHWLNRKSEAEARVFVDLALSQASRRTSLADELNRELRKRADGSGIGRPSALLLFQRLFRAFQARVLSEQITIHGPNVDIFGAISAAYDRLEASGELGDPEYPDLDRGEGQIEWYDSWDDIQGEGDLPDLEFDPERPFGDPDQYPEGEDYEPLPSKEDP